ncbi:hypothetical protein D3C83_127340 [compost metagenome]
MQFSVPLRWDAMQKASAVTGEWFPANRGRLPGLKALDVLRFQALVAGDDVERNRLTLFQRFVAAAED